MTDAPSILIVDDTPANLDLLSEILRKRGYRVRPALNGELALSAAAAAAPDLILLDIIMPAMDGYEVCRRLKADPQTRDIPVIFISIHSSSDEIVRAFELGGVDYVTKPFQPREVFARVESQLALVAQRRQLEAYYQREMERYEALDRMKQQFIYSATHDLKNPLNIIWGYVHLLAEMNGAEFDQQGREFVEGMRWGAQRMQRLITDMLDLAQMQTTANLDRLPTDLDAFLTNCLNPYALLAQQHGLTFTYTPPDEPVIIDIDANRMQHVVDNLISNAVKYTGGGGQVALAVTTTPTTVTLHVSDTGMGIPENAIPDLFNPFFRVDTVAHRKIEGTGLGLSIVDAVVRQHGGTVTVESTPQIGSTFSVTLPRAVR